MLHVADPSRLQQLNRLAIGPDSLAVAAAPEAVCKKRDQAPTPVLHGELQSALPGVGGRRGGCDGGKLLLELGGCDALGSGPEVGGEHGGEGFQGLCF